MAGPFEEWLNETGQGQDFMEDEDFPGHDGGSWSEKRDYVRETHGYEAFSDFNDLADQFCNDFGY